MAFNKTGLSEFGGETAAADSYQIIGTDCQIVQIPLAPNQEIYSEPGAMCYTSSNVTPKVKMGGILTGVQRAASGESLFKSHWTNASSTGGYIGLTSSKPASIIAVDMKSFTGGGLLCRRNAFLATLDTKTIVGVGFQRARSCWACMFSGLELVMQRITGAGIVFLQAHGTLIQKQLADGESLVVDTMAIVALAESVHVDVKCVGNCAMCLCAHEGAFNTCLTGPGLVVITSYSLDKLKAVVAAHAWYASSSSGGGAAAVTAVADH